MSEMVQLGMTDVASRRRGRGVKRLVWCSLLVVVVYVVIRNYVYIEQGMLGRTLP